MHAVLPDAMFRGKKDVSNYTKSWYKHELFIQLQHNFLLYIFFRRTTFFFFFFPRHSWLIIEVLDFCPFFIS